MPAPMAAPPKIIKYEPSKPAIKCDIKLKPFGWKRVIIDRNGLNGGPASNKPVDNTMKKLHKDWQTVDVIWVDIEEYGPYTLDDVKTWFPNKTKEKPVAAAAVSVPKLNTFFAGDISDKLSIMLSRFPPNAETIISAVDELKENRFNLEKLKMLLKAWPSEGLDDLMEQFKESGEDLAKWDKAEKYFITLLRAPKIEKRLKMWKFKQETEPKIKGIISDLELVDTAFKEVKENPYVKKLLGSILKIGNMMNCADAKKCQADGFDMESMNKCNSMRDVNNRSIYKIIV